jgi:sugar phosphate isomerase/epimerase
MAHPRISVNSLSSFRQSFDDDLALWKELGVEHVGLISPKMEAIGWKNAPTLVEGLRVSNIAAEVHVLHESIDLAAMVGADVVYICSGTIGARLWEQAAAAFVTDMKPFVDHAREAGVRLGVEPTNPLRSDLSFLFTYRDAVDVARDAAMTAVLDLYSCWYERGLEQAVRADLGMLSLVQICDFKVGTSVAGSRAVVGDGDIPLEALLAMLLDAGYEGAFDLEIIGTAIEEEGYHSAVGRSLDRLSEVLERLGA